MTDTSSASLYVKNKKFLVNKRLAQWQNIGLALKPKLGRGFDSRSGGSFFQKNFFFRNDQKISGMMKKQQLNDSNYRKNSFNNPKMIFCPVNINYPGQCWPRDE